MVGNHDPNVQLDQVDFCTLGMFILGMRISIR